MAGSEKQASDRFSLVWQRVCVQARAELGQSNFSSWLGPVRVVSADEQCVRLAAPTAFHRDQIARVHGELIARLIAREGPEFGRVEYVVVPRTAPPPNGDAPKHAAKSAPSAIPGSPPLNRDYTFGNFVIGRANQVAVNEALRTAEADAPLANPLFLFGDTGLGKSHLATAVAIRMLERRPNLRVSYVPSEWFVRNFISAVRGGGNIDAFKALMRGVDLLILDDAHFLEGKDASSEEFLHIFDALLDAKKQIVLTADRSPARLEKLNDRTRSRLLTGTSVEITASDFDLRLAILEAKAARFARQRPDVAIGSEVLRFMAQRISANTRALEGALNRVVCYANDGAQPVTLANLQIWLADFFMAHDRRVTIEEIKSKGAAFFSCKVSDLESESRARDVVRPRQICMYVARRMTTRSLPDIAHRFNKRDHTTVLHAIRTVEARINSDPEFARMVEAFRLSIRNWPDDRPPTSPHLG